MFFALAVEWRDHKKYGIAIKLSVIGWQVFPWETIQYCLKYGLFSKNCILAAFNNTKSIQNRVLS